MADDDDIFLSMGGGSLLNDLLSDLDAAITANESTSDDPTDELFASLKHDTFMGGSTTNNSAGAFVVRRQPQPLDVPASTAAGEDAWSAALAQFGGMSLAEEFLAADSAKKHQQQKQQQRESESANNDVVFDDYELSEEAQVRGVDETGGLMALLGASRAKSQKKEEEAAATATITAKEVMQSPQATGVKAPPPSPMFPPPIMPHMPIMLPPAHMMPPPHTMMMPPPPGVPHGIMPPPPPPPHPHRMPDYKPAPPQASVFKNQDFPALNATPQEIQEAKEEEAQEHEPSTTPPSNNFLRPNILFNNPDPSAPPINAALVQSSLMPSRDITFVVNAMMRPLATLDAYNDDYYHWSYVDRKSRNLLSLPAESSSSGIIHPNLLSLPEPVWTQVKLDAKERESKYRHSMEVRSMEFALEKKSLGRMVKSNVHRPKALLVTTPSVTNEWKDENIDDDTTTMKEETKDTSYETEQRNQRIQTWKARMAIDKGYTAYLTLVELRRLIQANVGATQRITELTEDVKANVNLLHASLGIVVKNDGSGRKKIHVDTNRLESTLSMPKGRSLLARVVEGGILPHASACELLPVAMGFVFRNALPAMEGEERLLRALAGLVLTVQPAVEPILLVKCLDVAISVGSKDITVDGKKMPNITGSRTRMELLHAILARGKAVCGEVEMFGWGAKETQFMALLT